MYYLKAMVVFLLLTIPDILFCQNMGKAIWVEKPDIPAELIGRESLMQCFQQYFDVKDSCFNESIFPSGGMKIKYYVDERGQLKEVSIGYPSACFNYHFFVEKLKSIVKWKPAMVKNRPVKSIVTQSVTLCYQ